MNKICARFVTLVNVLSAGYFLSKWPVYMTFVSDNESNSYQVSLASSADMQQSDLEDADLQIHHQGGIIHVTLNEPQVSPTVVCANVV